MSREFTVQYWQPWETEEGPVRDAHGNFKGSVFFEEDARNVDATFKTQPEKGDKKYGDIVEYKTKAGKTRLKFQRADRPMDGQTSFTGDKPAKREWQPRDDDSIKAQWAIGRAYETIKPRDDQAWKLVKQDAQLLLVMVEDIKSPKLPPLTPRTPEQQDKDEDKEFAASVRKSFDDPIDINDIPF